MKENSIEALFLEIRNRSEREILFRASAAMEFLLGEIKRAYHFAGSHGESGALGGLMIEVKKAKGFIVATVGVTKAAKYLANLDQGERGTISGHAGDPHAFVRTKAPPIKNIYRWITLAAITIPAYYKKRAEGFAAIAKKKRKPKWFDPSKPWYSDDPQVLFAFDIAMKRKKYGFKGLHVIEQTAKVHASKISKYLEGA